ncbi:hypothetical protein AAG906_018590 [Vitis piasezkii]
MPLELPVTGGSLSSCAKDDECKVNLSINDSCCKQIREVVEEKSNILLMINEQTLPSQGCGRPLESPTGSPNNKIKQILPSQDCKIPLEHFSMASSPTDCAEGNVQKVTARFDGSSVETVTEVVEKKSDIFLGSNWNEGRNPVTPTRDWISEGKEDATHVLWNLYCHSEDIRACVESAGAITTFLWLLKSGGLKGHKVSAMALGKLVRIFDSATINQLLALLLGDSPSSKAHIIKVLGHVQTVASHEDLAHKGSAASKGLTSPIQVLNSSNEGT